MVLVLLLAKLSQSEAMGKDHSVSLLHLHLCQMAGAASTLHCGPAHARVTCYKSTVEIEMKESGWIGIQFYQLHGPRQIVSF